MKKLILPLILFLLNLAVYYYMTEFVGINSTFEEMVTILVINIIVVPFGVLPIAAMQYYFKLSNPQRIVFTPFKQIFIKLYLNFLVAIYAVMLFIALLTYLNMQ